MLPGLPVGGFITVNSARVPGRGRASAVWTSCVQRLHRTWFCPGSKETCGNLNRTDCCQDSGKKKSNIT